MKPFLPIKGALINAPLMVGNLFAPHLRINLSIIFLLLISFQTYGQSDWTLLKDEGGVTISYQVAQVTPEINSEAVAVAPADLPQYLKLKIENSNSTDITVSWKQEIKTDGNSGLINFIANPGESIIDNRSMVPLLQLTRAENDQYPKSFTEYMDLFTITIKP
ncbi:hypothetical protein BFP97_07590 [Roseivirga sp. 4D4]|uniref:hypothetical protein n=1 Tax=Roseivirga sp. 4D4 TaxID=1889784 RepID=UPI000853AAB4|nr:hypothetical protein [Roseivirga sp. 4D4]OEK01388.1 hypothetical protein BFP97_07590 [Roseivirga sp. 4D4]